MKKFIDLASVEASSHFLKGASYFNSDLPSYISFEPILAEVSVVLGSSNYATFRSAKPANFSGVNYNFLSNKDGKFAWRPLELIHPVIYVSLVNAICSKDNWSLIKSRFSDYKSNVVECCSDPVISLDEEKDVAKQITSWWQNFEQRSLCYSLEFSHILHTDVTDCYGSLYTHSISWALHGLEKSKKNKGDKTLLGNIIDSHIQESRYGQTNGISQGSVLMDFVAEIVLGYVDEQISISLNDKKDFKILRYRDDYRIFANSDERVEEILKTISQKLWMVGMRLAVSKTVLSRNVVEGSIKPEKLAGIDLQDLGVANAQTIQKQLLRLHSFGQRFPNSGALRRLVSEFHTKISKEPITLNDLEVQIAIATDIGFVSPSTFPAIAGILSHLISKASSADKDRLWNKVCQKMRRVPYNGYLEIWLQRVTKPKTLGMQFTSDEYICRIVNGEPIDLWENRWIKSPELKEALHSSRIFDEAKSDVGEVIQPEEVELYTRKALQY